MQGSAQMPPQLSLAERVLLQLESNTVGSSSLPAPTVAGAYAEYEVSKKADYYFNIKGWRYSDVAREEEQVGLSCSEYRHALFLGQSSPCGGVRTTTRLQTRTQEQRQHERTYKDRGAISNMQATCILQQICCTQHGGHVSRHVELKVVFLG